MSFTAKQLEFGMRKLGGYCHPSRSVFNNCTFDLRTKPCEEEPEPVEPADLIFTHCGEAILVEEGNHCLGKFYSHQGCWHNDFEGLNPEQELAIENWQKINKLGGC